MTPRTLLVVMPNQDRGVVREYVAPVYEETYSGEFGENSDPSSMSYEELLELGDRIGHVRKGLKEKDIQSLPTKIFRSQVENAEDGAERCAVCQEVKIPVV